jgi:uncharacterized protein
MKTVEIARITRCIAALAWLALSWPAQAQPVLGQNDQVIHDAARMGNGNTVSRILQANPALRDARTGLGSTPLHLAATNPDSGPLKVLLAAGANVDAEDTDSATPLHMAAYANRIENAKILLEAGADPHAQSSSGRTALMLARKSRADEIAGLIALWILKACKGGGKCEQASTLDINRLSE